MSPIQLCTNVEEDKLNENFRVLGVVMVMSSNITNVLPLSCSSSVTDSGEWTEEEIASLKEGLRKYGRAWGKIYREVGSQKTATQCKQFYDDFCNDELLNLNQALLEHSSIKVHGACLLC